MQSNSEEIKQFNDEDSPLAIKNELTKRWLDLAAASTDIFRYNLDTFNQLQKTISSSDASSSSYPFLIQLNPDRSTKRRPPQTITTITPQFNANEFNFNKINQQEILLRMGNTTCLINNSPLTKYHSLLCPRLADNLPQILIADLVEFCVRLLIGFADERFKIGYNSPGALASVNHLHAHLIYLENRLAIEDVKLQLIGGRHCYKLVDSLVNGFCFCVQNASEIRSVCSDVMALVERFCQENIPHNLVWTTTTSTIDANERVAGRIFVFPRERMNVADKEYSSFNVGFCELAGYVTVGNAETYETITSEMILAKITETIGNGCDRVERQVVELFCKN